MVLGGRCEPIRGDWPICSWAPSGSCCGGREAFMAWLKGEAMSIGEEYGK